jgi:hypothetical protein
VAANSLQITATISGQLCLAANNMIISGHYVLAANNVAANDQISCSGYMLQLHSSLFTMFYNLNVILLYFLAGSNVSVSSGHANGRS